MRFYKNQHQFYIGIDLHARTMYICVINNIGETVFHKNEDSMEVQDPVSYSIINSVPGLGFILSLTILYEIDDIHRFSDVGKFIFFSQEKLFFLELVLTTWGLICVRC